MEDIKKDLGVSDTAMGLLTGVYFSMFYLIAGVPLARLADIGSRRTLIAVSLAVWSTATMCCGLAQSYAQLAISRIFVATGEAGSSPATYSLIANIFPLARRTRFLAVITAGACLGTSLGIFIGGALHDVLSWRMVFVVAGAPGLLLALLLRLTLPEPQRTQTKTAQAPSTALASLAALFRIPTFRALCITAFAGGLAGFGILAWVPTFLTRVHHMSSKGIGAELSIATGLGLICGSLSSGYLADRLARTHPRRLIWASCFGLLACVPFGVAVAFAPDGRSAIIAFGFFMYFFGFWTPPVTATALAIAPERSRAMASAASPFFQSLGSALGPFLIGALNDALAPTYGSGAIRFSILSSAVSAGIAGLACLVGARLLARDLKVTAGGS